MPTNEMHPFYEVADRVTGQVLSGQSVTGKRFIRSSGNRTSGPSVPASPAAGASDNYEGGNYQFSHVGTIGAAASGVSTWDAAQGEKVGCVMEGICPVEAGAAIPAGSAVMSDATGRAIAFDPGTIDATSANTTLPLPVRIKLGICLTAASGAGVDAEIKLSL
jgi:hypothetical protein